LCKKLRKDAQK
jgi:hypothetical protein